MSIDPHDSSTHSTEADTVSMPRPTIAPLVLAAGLAMAALGVALGPAFLVVGALILLTGLGLWVSELLPGRGHFHEPLAEPSRRARMVAAIDGGVEHLQAGMPGYRLRMPETVHPISAGLKGGIVGGLVMTVPALAYGVFSGHGLWYPANLLTGMLVPRVDRMSTAELEQFRPALLLIAIVIHAVNSVVFGMIYGVLLPTLPRIPRPIAWGGLLIPLLWSGVSYVTMGFVTPMLRRDLDWPWFIASQFVFGVVAALAVMRTGATRPLRAGLIAGVAGGVLMPVPALLWGLLSGNGVWYPANLLAGMVLTKLDALPLSELKQLHTEWLAIAVAIHAVMSLGIGLIFGMVLPRLKPIPTPVVWGGLLMPLLWTAVSYGLMGVVNPLLQERVDWPWFIVSQFIFGMLAAIVVIRSEVIYIPPAGRGPDRLEPFLEGTGEAQP
jgi:hypothetical protein